MISESDIIVRSVQLYIGGSPGDKEYYVNVVMRVAGQNVDFPEDVKGCIAKFVRNELKKQNFRVSVSKSAHDDKGSLLSFRVYTNISMGHVHQISQWSAAIADKNIFKKLFTEEYLLSASLPRRAEVVEVKQKTPATMQERKARPAPGDVHWKRFVEARSHATLSMGEGI